MHEQILDTERAIRRGIKSVGVGKKGSKDLDPQLVSEILTDLQAGNVSDAEKGAFFAGLLFKGISKDELLLEGTFVPGLLRNPAQLAYTLSGDAPQDIQEICAQIFQGHELNKETAEQLGDFLFSDLPGDGVRGLASVALRVRYETPDEYEGLLKSINKTFTPGFRTLTPTGEPIIQIADPFDGVDHSFSITPIIAMLLQRAGYRVVSVAGRNSGPKFGNNLYDLARHLQQTFLFNNKELANPKPPLGWIIDQKNLSLALDRWVNLRHQIIKRPFLATIERFVNPCSAKTLIASAFHPPYGEKMLELGERAGFPNVIIIRNGMEGTIAFPLKRSTKLLCSARQSGGKYVRHEFEFNPTEFLGWEPPVEERQDLPSLEENVRLIQEFVKKGKTANKLFDNRVKATYAGLKKAMAWLQSLEKGQQ